MDEQNIGKHVCKLGWLIVCKILDIHMHDGVIAFWSCRPLKAWSVYAVHGQSSPAAAADQIGNTNSATEIRPNQFIKRSTRLTFLEAYLDKLVRGSERSISLVDKWRWGAVGVTGAGKFIDDDQFRLFYAASVRSGRFVGAWTQKLNSI